MQVPFVDLSGQRSKYAAFEAAARVVDEADFILGEDVTLFEREFAAFCEVRHAIGVDSGTSALELALRALGLGRGDEVLTPANSFIATALAISYTGATPVFVDVDPDTQLMDPELLGEALTAKTRAIVPVHLYGQPADMSAIMAFADRHELVVVEDACQAHGARHRNRSAGSIGHAAAFSFYPAKNLGAWGDGGAVVTDDARVADAVRLARNYGSREKYHHLVPGFNRRLDTLQAAVLRAKLPYLAEANAARREHARRYDRLLAGTGVALPVVAEDATPVYHLYVVRVAERAPVQAELRARGVATGVHYPVPIHLQPAYRYLGYRRGDFPVTERAADQILSLPMYPELTPEQVAHVAAALREVTRGAVAASVPLAAAG